MSPAILAPTTTPCPELAAMVISSGLLRRSSPQMPTWINRRGSAFAEQQGVGGRNERLERAGPAPELQEGVGVRADVHVQWSAGIGHRCDDGVRDVGGISAVHQRVLAEVEHEPI